MILSISNIAWTAQDDEIVYAWMKQYGYTGLDIAPTRVFPQDPYSHIEEARRWSFCLREKYGFVIPSIQSIWYGRQEHLFGTKEERTSLLTYTEHAVDFAAAIGCRNLVFGCPRNRNLPVGMDPKIAVGFFRQLGDYAAKQSIWVGLEANPPIYHTNYINTTIQALDLIREVNSPGFRLNLDVGTMIANREGASVLSDSVGLIGHVHISEPGLGPIEKRTLHQELLSVLRAESYSGAVSIEMSRAENMEPIETALKYVRGLVYNGE